MRDLGARSKFVATLVLLAAMFGCQALIAGQPSPQQPQGANLSFSDSTLDFGSVAIGSDKTLSVTLVNGASGSVTVTGAAASRATFALTAPQLPVIISAGQRSSFDITFTPVAGGTDSATVSLATDASAEPVNLVVAGQGANPGQLGSNPASIDFGIVGVGNDDTKPATLTNIGGTSLTITQLSTSGNSFQLGPVALPLTLDPGQGVDLSVTFAPQAGGQINGSVSVTTGGAPKGGGKGRNGSNFLEVAAKSKPRDGSSFKIPLSGIGMTPGQLSASPAGVNFGNVTVGGTAHQSVTLTNTGGATVTVSQATVSGTGFSYSGLNLPLVLQPGGNSSFTVSFNPQSPGNAAGNVAIVSDADNSPLNVPLSGTGVADGSLSANPSSVDFGSVQVGSSQKQSVTLTNNGGTDVKISQATVTGEGFSISGLNLPLTLSPGDSTSFTAKFAPLSPGDVNGNVSITNDGSNPTLQVPLSGTGVAAGTLTADPASFSFGNVQVGNNQVLPGKLTNTGGSQVTITQATVTGNGFSVSGLNLPLTLQAGQSANFNVKFSPSAPGQVNGNIAIINDGSNPTLYVPLSGAGVAPGFLSTDPSSIDFGNVQVGQKQIQSETLSNTGGVKLTVSQATVTGNGFSISGLNLPLTLDPGQRFTFGVNFIPSSGGNFSGNIALVSDGANPNVNVPLSGSGVMAGQLSVSPPTLDFGDVTVGTNKNLIGTLSASGANVTVSSYSIASTEFTLSGLSFPLTVVPGQNVQFTVTFTPQMSGIASTTLTFVSDASNSPTIQNLTGNGIAPPQHNVDLTWNASPTPGVVGYNVYRGAIHGGPYSKINSALAASTAYTDDSVQAGQTYYYVTTSVDSGGLESIYSNEAQAVVPTP